MPNKSKQKGTRWERDLVTILEDKVNGAIVNRIAGSGALGTVLNEPLLQGDLQAKFVGFSRPFRIEAKTGYGGENQHVVKREWLNKIMMEANNNFQFPALACKFSGARRRDGTQYFIALDLNTFCDIINYVGYLFTAVENKRDGN